MPAAPPTSSAPSPAPLLSVRDAAVRLGCSPDHVYDLISAGQLSAVNIGIKASKTRLRPEELEAFITRRTRRA